MADEQEVVDAAPPLADGRYRLMDILGEGGMATVYRAYDERLQVARAIKILNPNLVDRQKVRARFEAEARTMAAMNHPHIVQVFDVGLEEGKRPYIVMELVTGGSLVDWVTENGPMPPRTAVDVTLDVLGALTKAHEHGIVHRDIKPHNVLLTESGEIRVTDFGIARLRQQDEDALTRTGAVMGTWGFMAPEQRVNAKGVDATADVYAVGATLWGLIKNQTPVDLFMVDMEPSLLEGVPEPVAQLISVACRYKREERYPSAQAMIEACLAAREALPEPTQEVRIQPGQRPARSFSSGSLGLGVATPEGGTRGPTAVPPLSTPPVTPVPDDGEGNSTFMFDQAAADLTGADLSSSTGTMAPSDELEHTGSPRRSKALVLALLGFVGLGVVAVGATAILVPTLLSSLSSEPDPVQEPVAGPTPPPEGEGIAPTESAPPEGEALAGAPEEGSAPDEAVAEAQPEEAAPPEPAEAAPAEAAPAASSGSSSASRGSSSGSRSSTGTSGGSASSGSSASPAPAASSPPAASGPAIEHRPVRSASVGDTVNFTARITGSSAYDRVVLFYRSADGGAYQESAMFGSGGSFSTSVTLDDSFAGGLQYFIDARSTAGGVEDLRNGSPFRPHKVSVR